MKRYRVIYDGKSLIITPKFNVWPDGTVHESTENIFNTLLTILIDDKEIEFYEI